MPRTLPASATERRPYDAATITVMLEAGYQFSFQVEDWDIDNDTPLTDAEAFAMADGLIRRDRVELFGTFAGPTGVIVNGWTTVDPDRVIAIAVSPTGGRGMGR